MKLKRETDRVIAELAATTQHRNLTMRERYLLTETMHSLVRLAKSELMAEIRSDVHRLTGDIATPARRRRSAAMDYRSPQQRFEFNQLD